MSEHNGNPNTDFFSLLLVAFIVMKLAHIGDVAQWSWWLVLSPLWAGLALALIVFVIFYAVRR